MKTLSLAYRFVFFFMSFVAAHVALGQVNVTIRVLPPYQSRITEYASRPDLMLLTLTNTSTTAQRVQLTGSITGDNGVGAWVSPGYRSPQPIDLAPGQALSLNGSDIAFLFDHNQIQYTGISQADFTRGRGLLEGTYQLCIRALDYDTQEPLSPEEPVGCTPLVISSVEPPTIIQPFNEQELRADGPQAFPITWSTPPGASPLTQYKVKMVEMIIPRNPNDAMQSATTPPFFEETLNTNMLLYGPQYPQLTPGRQYALMVQAIDPYNTISFRNQGMSEVIMFTYGQESPIAHHGPVDGIELYFPYAGLDTIRVYRDSAFYARWGFEDAALNDDVEFVMTIADKASDETVFQLRDLGRLYYQSPLDSLDFLQSENTYRIQVTGVDPTTGAVVGRSRQHDFVYHRVSDQQANSIDSVTLLAAVRYQYDGYADRYPYQGKVYVYEAQPVYRQVNADSVLLTGYVRNGNAVASAETDAEGNVRMNIVQPTPDAHYLMAFHNPYFADPDEAFKLNASTALEDRSTASQQQNRHVEQRIGEITTTVKSFSLKLSLTKGYGYMRDILLQSTGVHASEVQAGVRDENKQLSSYLRTDTLAMINESLNGLIVRIYRKGKPTQVPLYEGGRLVAPDNDPNKLVLVGTDTTRLVTDEQGVRRAVADIDRLLWSQSASDLYHIRVTDPATDSIVIEQPFRFHPSGQQRAQQVEPLSPTHYLVNQGLSWVVSDPPLATVKGRLLYRWFDGEGGTHPLANKRIRLEPYYVFEDPQTGKMSALNGNAEGQIVRVNSSNQKEPLGADEVFGNRPPVISASAVTETGADGSFEFKDFALYDSIFTYEGHYNLVPVQFEVPEIPPALQDPGQLGQQNPGSIWDEDGGNTGSGIWTPGGGFTLPGGGPVLPDFLSDLLPGGGSGPGSPFPGGGPGVGIGPGSPRTLDRLAQSGVLSQVGLGVSMKNTSPEINGVVNSKKVVTKGGASALKMEQFHSGVGNMGGVPLLDVQQQQFNQRGGPSWEEHYVSEARQADGVQLSYDKPMKLHRTFRVIIEDNRFLSPDDNVEINPLEVVDVGTLYSLVNSYKARVKVVERNPSWDSYMVQQDDLPQPNDYRSRYHPQASIDKNSSPGLTNIKIQQEKGEYTMPMVEAMDIIGEDVESSVFSQADANRNMFMHLVNHTRYSFMALTNDTIQGNNSYVGTNTEEASSGARYGSRILQFFNAGSYYQFNSEFQDKTRDLFLVLEPKAPVVAGRVLNDKGTVPISGAVVALQIGEGTGGKRYQQTDKDGYFVFSGLPDGTKVTLSCDVPGYTPKAGGQRFSEVRSTLQNGEKWFKEIYFTPSARVRGLVVNDEGEQIPALVKVEGTGQLVETECGPDGVDKARARSLFERGLISAAQWSQHACNEEGGYFQVGVQAGVPARIIITPLDLQYFPDTVELQQPVEGLNDLQTRRLSRRLHRMEFVIRASGLDAQSVELEGTKIELLDTVLTASRTNAEGLMGGSPSTTYQFANISQHNFWIKVTPPEGSGYVPKEITLTSYETKEAVRHVIELEDGDAIWGTVTTGGTPLADAEVSVYQGDGAATVRVLTDASGQYRISGLRRGEGTLQVQASAPESGAAVAGKTQRAEANTEVNFDLAAYNKLDISSLLGYQVRITDLKDEGNEAVVSGELLLPEEGEFTALDDNRTLTFSEVRVRANAEGLANNAGVPLAEPVDDMALDNISYRTRFGAYNVLLQGQAGSQSVGALHVRKSGATAGELEAYARVVDNSFDFPSSYLKFEDSEFYFAVAGAGSGYTNKLALAPTGADNRSPKRYHFSNATGGALAFRYLNFDATSEVADNYFENGNIHIKPVIHARVNTLGDGALTIAMPSLHFNTVDIADAQGNEAIEFKLEEWTVHIPEWKAATDEGGIVATSGQNYVRTGAGLDLYFDAFRLVQLGTSDELVIDGVRANNIKLGGFHPIQVYGGTNTLFGLDMKTGNDLQPHYILRMLGKGNNMAGKIDNLPGFAGGLEIQAVTLVSNGQQYVSFAPNSREVNVHGVVGFKPSMLTDSEGGFVVEGNLDMGIPHMPALSGGFEFKPGSGGGSPQMTLRLRALEFELKGNVRFRSEAVSFNDNGRKFIRPNELEIWGTAAEPGKLDEIPVRLLKKMGGGTPAIDIQLRGANYVMKMDGDKISMDVSKAWTKVVGDTWDYFQFTGKMTDGFASGGFGRELLTFKVHGDIKLEDGQVKLTEIQTPFGEVALVFDWQRKEMRGSIAIQDANGGKIGFPGGVKAKGMAEILLGPQGFYFMAAVDAEIDPLPLISPFSAGFVIGYHDAIPQEVFEKATQHMYYKSYPCGENGVAFKGFMFAGRKDIIKPVDFSIAIPPVLTADISLEVGADVTFYTNFANGVEIALVVGVFGKVELVASTLASCTSLEGKVTLELMGRLAYANNTFVGEICASLAIATKVEQSTPPFCTPKIFDFDEAITIGAKLGLEATGSGVKPYFQLTRESCSSGTACHLVATNN